MNKSWYEIVTMIIMAGGGLGGITLLVRELIRWRRHSKEDSAAVEQKKAEAKRILVDADVTLSDHALKHLQDIRNEYAREREINSSLRKELQDAKDELDTARETLVRLDSKVRHLSVELEKKDEIIRGKDSEIEQLMMDIQRYKNSRGGRPHH